MNLFQAYDALRLTSCLCKAAFYQAWNLLRTVSLPPPEPPAFSLCQVMSMIPGFNEQLMPKGMEKESQARIKRFMTIMDSMTDEGEDLLSEPAVSRFVSAPSSYSESKQTTSSLESPSLSSSCLCSLEDFALQSAVVDICEYTRLVGSGGSTVGVPSG
jgi:hypothetical protein